MKERTMCRRAEASSNEQLSELLTGELLGGMLVLGDAQPWVVVLQKVVDVLLQQVEFDVFHTSFFHLECEVETLIAQRVQLWHQKFRRWELLKNIRWGIDRR